MNADARTAALRGIALLAAGLLIVPLSAGAQVPDNRGVSLDPSEEVAPAYRDTIVQRDADRLERARGAGESYLPTVQGRGSARPAPASTRKPATATRTPRTIEEYSPVRVAPVVRRSNREAAGQASGLGDTLDVLFETWNRPPQVLRIRYPDVPSGSAVMDAEPAYRAGLHVHAGTGLYARTLHAVESGQTAPVLIEILQPPLAGAVAAGSFTRTGNRLALKFDRLHFKGRSFDVDAWAVAPDCGCFSVRGEVDYHLVERVLLPAAAGFAESFLASASRPAESVTLSGSDIVWNRQTSDRRSHVMAGLGAVARSLNSLFAESAHRKPTVRIPADTEIVFLVVESPIQAAARQASGSQEGTAEDAR